MSHILPHPPPTPPHLPFPALPSLLRPSTSPPLPNRLLPPPLQAFTEQLLQQNLGLPGWLVAPPFAGMTLAEVIESASQGSSVHGPASIASFLEYAVLVDGTGALIRSQGVFRGRKES